MSFSVKVARVLILILLQEASEKLWHFNIKGSDGGEVVRATASKSRGPEFKSTWSQGFFLFFYQQQCP